MKDIKNCASQTVVVDQSHTVAFPAAIQHTTSHSLDLNVNSPNITVGRCEHPVFVDQRPAAEVSPPSRLDGDDVLDGVLSGDIAAHYPALYRSVAWHWERQHT